MKAMKSNKRTHRLLAVLLCACMVIGLLTDLSGIFSWKVNAQPIEDSRHEADPSTMDTYLDALNFSENTRYAGRLWSDKTVFAYNDQGTAKYPDSYGRKFETKTYQDSNGKDITESKLTLTPALDGISEEKEVLLDSDFLHVFSVLGSSQQINDGVKAPIDLVILLDMSGSMATDTEVSTRGTHTHIDIKERISHSRIYKVLTAINTSIETLMALNETNQVAVVAYGTTAYTLLPLGHYEKVEGHAFLEVDDFKAYNGNGFGSSNSVDDIDYTGSGAYTVTSWGNKTDKGVGTPVLVNNSVRNNYNRTYVQGNFTLIGFHTDMQAGIYQGFSELYNSLKSVEDVTYTYRSMITGKDRTIPRIPAAFVMTDGGSNYTLKAATSASATGNEWYEVPIAEKTEGDYDKAYKKYRSESDRKNLNAAQQADYDSSGIILDILLTASFMKSKVLNRYSQLLAGSQVSESEKSDAKFIINTISVDTPTADYQVPRVYTTMDPRTYFQETLPSQPVDATQWVQKEDALNAYQTWKEWQTASKTNISITANVYDTAVHQTTFSINTLPADGWTDINRPGFAVTNEDVIKNINYSDGFYDVDTAKIDEAFASMLASIQTTIFTPVGGGNDLGVEDSITYMDPLGKYMNLKDVKLLTLFGKTYNVTKTAVYDWSFNTNYMTAKGHTGEQFKNGWYKGDGSASTTFLEGDPLGNGDSIPKGSSYKNSEEAWADGWVYYVNSATAAQFVPNLEFQDDVPANPGDKIQNTTYTFYRLELSTADREALHMNPAYGTDDEIPKSVHYDGTTQNHLGTPGVYALADLRVWVEDSGDYNDPNVESGGIASDANFDEALYVNIPVNMLPLRTITINREENDSWTYETNIKKKNNDDDQSYLASFPLRLIYTVGLDNSMKTADGSVDLALGVGPEYIADNRLTTQAGVKSRGGDLGSVEFFSNWYNPENRYTDYVTTNTDYSYGDAVVSFSPSTANRYYIFEKPLPLYSTVYEWAQESNGEGFAWRRVVMEEDYTEEMSTGGSTPGAGGTTSDDADDTRYLANPNDFNGRLIAQDLEPYNDQTSHETRQENIWNALHERGIYKDATDVEAARTAGADVSNPQYVKAGDVILLKDRRLADVTYEGNEGETDPFSSNAYFYMPVDYYELDEATNVATPIKYVVARKGSEFGSAYSAAGITNGSMLCWYDASGTYSDVYPYLSRSDTGDDSRGRNYIGTEPEYYKAGEPGYVEGKQMVKPLSEMSADAQAKHNAMIDGPQKGDWVVAARPGGLRVGGLARNVGEKGSTWTVYDEDYIKQRFGEDKTGLDWGYYSEPDGNITRTANNYYVPTISVNSDAEKDDIIVNVYLGNNGRLWIPDTTLLVTKLVGTPGSDDMLANDSSNYSFDFQVFINGFTGPREAVRVRYNGASGTWQRQIHYIDMELSANLMLQTNDAQLALVDGTGCLLVADTEGKSSSGYIYAEDCIGTDQTAHKAKAPYEGDVNALYYVYIGSPNQSGVGGSSTTLRVYHNPFCETSGETIASEHVTVEYYDEQGQVIQDPGLVLENYNGKREFYATSVSLIPKEAYDNWLVEPAGKEVTGLTGVQSFDKFYLATLDPTIQGTSEVSVISPYRTQSSYLTQTVNFGYKANGDKLQASDLFVNVKEVISDLPQKEKVVPEDNTAEFTLQSGWGLLFSSMTSGTDYALAEKLSSDDVDAGYSFQSVQHVHQGDQPTNYGPSNCPHNFSESGRVYYVTGDTGTKEEAGHFTNTVSVNKTELTPGNGKLVGIGEEITYEITWHNYESDKAKVFVMDTLDPGVDYQGSSSYAYETNGAGEKVRKDEVQGGVEGQGSSNLLKGGVYYPNGGEYVVDGMTNSPIVIPPHTVFWDLGEQAANSTGYVGLVVKTNENAKLEYDYINDGTDFNPDRGTSTTDDYRVVNMARARVGNHDFLSTRKVENPVTDKEEETPGNDMPVKIGDDITYTVHWENLYQAGAANDGKALVTITDPLDKGVDFREASFGGVKLTLGADGTTNGNTETLDGDSIIKFVGKDTTGLVAEDGDGNTNVTITYNKDKHVVTWTFMAIRNANVNPDSNNKYPGDVTLIVHVNENAIQKWTYDSDTDLTNPGGSATPGEEDHEVINRAKVEVGNKASFTSKVENPVPEKTEKDAADPKIDLDGSPVQIGDTINYQVQWKNTYEKQAKVIIIDPLDKGVDFVSASFGGVELNLSEVADDEGIILKEIQDAAQASGTSGWEMRKITDTVGVVTGMVYTGTVKDDNAQEVGVVTVETDENGKIRMLTIVGKTTSSLVAELEDAEAEPDASGVKPKSKTVKIIYDVVSHEVKWEFTAIPNGAAQLIDVSGAVDLTVKVNEKAVQSWNYGAASDGTNHGGSDGTGTDYEVRNRAWVAVDDHGSYTNEVENPLPEKTEETPGDGVQVKVGDQIKYRVKWSNTYDDKSAEVEITDPLDIGVDFVSASFGGVTLDKKNGIPDGKGKITITGTDTTGLTDDTDKNVTITYDDNTRTVTWSFLAKANVHADQNCESAHADDGKCGDAILNVSVNEKAFQKWTYKEDDNEGQETQNSEDDKVYNRAQVSIDNKADFTNTVENPLPKKTEVTPGEGASIGVGDAITYNVFWENSHDTNAEVLISDPLDAGVDFVSASFGGVPLNAADIPGLEEIKESSEWEKSQNGDNIVYTNTTDENGNGVVIKKVETSKNDNLIKISITAQDTTELVAETEGQPGSSSATRNVTITYNYADSDSSDSNDDTHTVTWQFTAKPGTGSTSQGHTDPKEAKKYGAAVLNVKVNEKAIQKWTYKGTDTDNPYGQSDSSSQDYEVLNRALVSVDQVPVYTDIVQNPVPDKTETAVDRAEGNYTSSATGTVPDEVKQHVDVTEGGNLNDADSAGVKDGVWNGPLVKVGDRITYKITWKNQETEPAVITIEDPLDPGVAFVSASFGGVKLGKEEDISDLGQNPVSGTVRVTGHDADGNEVTIEVPVKIEYVAGTGNEQNKVKWTLGEESENVDGTASDAKLVPAGAVGDVKLVVEVTDRATSVGKVDNYAEVTVGGHPKQRTKTVENPTPKREKTEVTPGDGKLVGIGDRITYEIAWNNYKSEEATVIVMDTLDPGVNFISSNSYTYRLNAQGEFERDSNGNKILDQVITGDTDAEKGGKYYPDSKEITIYEGTPKEESITVPAHTVVWVLEKQSAGAQGYVGLVVEVNDRARLDYDYSDEADKLTTPENSEGDDYEVWNQARVKVGNDGFEVTQIVENPITDKTEEPPTDRDGNVDGSGDTDGDGVPVEVGSELTYKIHWENTNDKEATVIITDPLDNGVDFVSASDGNENGITLSAMENGGATKTSEMIEVDVPAEGGATTKESKPVIQYTGASTGSTQTPAHTVIWTFKAAKNTKGDVILKVRVNKNAVQKWTYGGETDKTNPGGSAAPGDKDYEVLNRALVKVDNDASYTSTVENPVPDKTETGIDRADTDDGNGNRHTDSVTEGGNLNDNDNDGTWEGPLVKVGDRITYEITWKNHETEDSVIAVTDPLDPGVKFFGASCGTAQLAETDITAQTPKYSAAGTVTFHIDDGNGETIPVTIQYVPGTDGQPNKVVWTIGSEAIKDESGAVITPAKLVPAGAEGTVRLVVEVMENATFAGKVENEATVKVSNHPEQHTKKVENPTPLKSKTEVNPGNGELVGIGEEITYEIAWNNYQSDPAYVIVMDTLDPGVDFVGSNSYPYVLEGDSYIFDKKGNVVIHGQGDGEQDGIVVDPKRGGTYYPNGGSITYMIDSEEHREPIPPHTVVWDLGVQNAGTSAYVGLVVRTNEKARLDYSYNGDATGFVPNVDGDGEDDYKVFDQARVKVGNDPFGLTQRVENPVTDKTEQDPYDPNKDGDGKLVGVGDSLTYHIHWENSHDTKADVVITDPLDQGVDFEAASFGGENIVLLEAKKDANGDFLREDVKISKSVTGTVFEQYVQADDDGNKNVTIEYNAASHTVTWTFTAASGANMGSVAADVELKVMP